MEETKNNEQNANIEPENKHHGAWSVVLISFVCASFFGAIFGFMGSRIADSMPQSLGGKLGKIFERQANISGLKNKDVSIDKEKIVQEDSVVIDMIEKSSPAVVSIVISKDVPKFKSMSDPFGFFFFNPFGNGQQGKVETEKKKVGGGTGFFVSDSGMIVTNKHVVQDLEAEYTVLTTDGKEYSAKVVALDPIKDVALIKVEGSSFPTIELGDSDQVKVGQTVVAIGNSLAEFSNSVSKGIVSGLKRNLVAGSGYGETEKLTNIIQTDAAINPGNSGGPLLNIYGKVIGINVAVAEGAENIGFAIPINQVKKVIEQVKTGGKISTPFLGVRYLPVDKQLQKENNLPFEYGVLVIRGEKVTDLAVMPGSPADKAGIVENDIILEINGNKIDEDNTLPNLIASFNVGEEVMLKVWHKGETKDVKVKLEESKNR